jgi:hypothetical protein
MEFASFCDRKFEVDSSTEYRQTARRADDAIRSLCPLFSTPKRGYARGVLVFSDLLGHDAVSKSIAA